MENEEKMNPHICAAIVLRCKIQDFGRLEQFIQNLHQAELIYAQKCPKNQKLRIVKESGEKEENGSRGFSQ